MKFPIPPGVFDILPHDQQEAWKSSYLWSYVENVIRHTARDYGYQEIRTPLFERTELFQRSVGETSDIVSKEMYTFEDKGGRSMSLRPEGTAPVMRSFVENQLHTTAPLHKLFYIGPMFRYERAQAGRYRQHHQFGVEAIGNGSPEQDAEVIDLLNTLYQRLGLKNLTLFINSIGDETNRQAFKQALIEYLKPQFHLLSPDSQNRFETNPLRILDSKDPRDREIVVQAPSILDFLNEEAKEHFEQLKNLLNILGISYQVNPFLVRGLDYYNRTVFEFVAGELGAQNSVGGGGRYDGLLQSVGGPDLPSIGFGTGIERIIQTMINQEVPLPKPDHPTLFLIALGQEAKKVCFSLLHQLRLEGIATQMDFSEKKLGKIMQYADQIHTTYVAVIGDHELEMQEIELKEMATGRKFKVPIADLHSILKLDIKSSTLMETWKELSTPFNSLGQTQFFIDKLKFSLEQTKKLSEHFQHHLERIKKLVEE
jgi:histidyl-tRNA synthetase